MAQEASHGKSNSHSREFASSASLCLLLLIGIFLLTWGIAHISPRVAAGMSRIQVYPWRMSDTGAAPCDCPFDLISWAKVVAKYAAAFRRLLALQITQETVWAEAMPRTEWRVAQASSDFFDCAPSSSPFNGAWIRVPDRLPQLY